MSRTKQINFESALQQLEEVVSAMEEESIPLEDLLKHYERGNQLIKECESSLTSARKQLETIKNKTQKPQNHATASLADQNNSNDEIRLF